MPDATHLAAIGLAFVAGELALAIAVGRLLARAGRQSVPVDDHLMAPVLDLAHHRALRQRA